ncbi:MAG TPA: ion transporter [Acidimicrobiia bacterium]|nr:ion transporter [Acidimicrobiia bacterium]
MDSDRDSFLLAVERRLELPMVVLSFVWLGLFVAEFAVGLTPELLTAGWIIWGLFVVDFALRLWLAPRRLRYLRRNWLTAISLIVPALRIFRAVRAVAILRGVRGLRVVRVAGSFNRALRALGRTFERRGFGYVVAATVAIVFLAAAAMYAFEGGTPGFRDYAETLWWSAMMVISVGSDAWPVTPEGRALAFLLALYGFSILGYVAATLTSFFIDRDAYHDDTALAGSGDIGALRREIQALRTELGERRQS